MIEDKEDKHIRWLQFFAIMMVVCGHLGYEDFFSFSVFPFYSFHMPLFVFISGYLFKDQHAEIFPITFLLKKIRKLLFPFYICLIFNGLLTNWLLKKGLIHFGQTMTLENFIIYPWTYGPKYSFTAAYWFIPVFFLCIVIHQMVYFILVKLDCRSMRTELFVNIFILIIGILAVYESRHMGAMWGGEG